MTQKRPLLFERTRIILESFTFIPFPCFFSSSDEEQPT